MSRKSNIPVFKTYIQHQAKLLPQSYDELIAPGHLVRVVNDMIEKLDLSALEAKYKGGGTSGYHPKMLLKVLVYAYIPTTISFGGVLPIPGHAVSHPKGMSQD